MAELDTYDVPFNDLENQLMGWVREALELRHGEANDPEGKLSLPTPSLGTGAVLGSLLRVRSRLDRVDELVSKATQAQYRITRAEASARFDADAAWDRAAQRNRAATVGQFTSAKERAADASLDSFEQKRTAHSAARLVSVATEALAVIKQTYWGLNALREDHNTVLRTLQFESSLER